MAPHTNSHSLLTLLTLLLLSTLSTPLPFFPRGTTDAPTLPSSSLPQPPAGLKLKYIGLGIGTQNYTCPATFSIAASGTTRRDVSDAEAATAATAPSAVGALAALYDITPLLQTAYGATLAPALAPLALGLYGLDHLTPASDPDATWQRLVARLLLPAEEMPKRLGTHFFGGYEGGSSPMWALQQGEGEEVLFVGAKNESVGAPAGACGGLGGEGAVDWLFLTEAAAASQGGESQSRSEGGAEKRKRGAARDGGVRAVYRVETAGGMQPETCEGIEGDVEVAYAAQYWFYGVDDEGEVGEVGEGCADS